MVNDYKPAKFTKHTFYRTQLKSIALHQRLSEKFKKLILHIMVLQIGLILLILEPKPKWIPINQTNPFYQEHTGNGKSIREPFWGRNPLNGTLLERDYYDNASSISGFTNNKKL